MSEMTHDILLQAICDQLKTAMPKLREALPHGGDFTANEIKRFSAAAPGIRVSCLAYTDPTRVSGGLIDYTLKMTAVIYTIDRVGLKRSEAAAAIARQCLLEICDSDWGLEWVHPALPADARTLYAPSLDRQGLALWQVRWDQKVRLNAEAASGVLPAALYVGIAPDVGPDHIDDYTQVVPDV
jgi:hypothetical protein